LATLFERKMQLRRRLRSGTHKDEGKEEGQRGVGREQYKRKPWLLGRYGEKLNSARTVFWRHFVNASSSSES
jgi:hypothetical protein